MATKRPELSKSEAIAELPRACADEHAAVEYLERKRWGDAPFCPHPDCGDTNVYRMTGRDGQRNKRFLWRCRGCGRMFTVRTNTVYAESLIPLHKWCHALWAAASAKNGVSALELSRRIQVSYKSALFLAHRIRHAMADGDPTPPKMTGIVEADETYIGPRKPRHKGTAANPINKRGRGTSKQPVAAVLQRGGKVRTRVIPVVNAANLAAMLRDNVCRSARLMTRSAQSSPATTQWTTVPTSTLAVT